MVKVLWFQQGGVRPAGTHRRHTELCQSLDVPAVGEVGPLTIHSSSNRAGSSFILPGEGFQRLRCDARPDPMRHTSNDKIRRLALATLILIAPCLRSRQRAPWVPATRRPSKINVQATTCGPAQASGWRRLSLALVLRHAIPAHDDQLLDR